MTDQHGRIVASRYLNASSRSTSKGIQTPVNSAKTAATRKSEKKQPRFVSRTDIEAPSVAGKVTILSEKTDALKITNDFKSAPRYGKTQPTSAPHEDTLTAAACSQSWNYMTSSLESAVESARITATEALESREKELSYQEAAIRDCRVRFECERLLTFYEELTSEKWESVPGIMKRFFAHEEACAQAMNNALHLCDDDFSLESPLKPYNDILAVIHELQDGASCLQSDISDMRKSRNGDNSIHQVLSASSSILQLRVQNLASAQTLMTICKQNVRLRIHADSHRIESF